MVCGICTVFVLIPEDRTGVWQCSIGGIAGARTRLYWKANGASYAYENIEDVVFDGAILLNCL